MTANTSTGRGTVVVGGATGYLGKYVVRALHRDGRGVRALARDRNRLGTDRLVCPRSLWRARGHRVTDGVNHVLSHTSGCSR